MPLYFLPGFPRPTTSHGLGLGLGAPTENDVATSSELESADKQAKLVILQFEVGDFRVLRNVEEDKKQLQLLRK